MSLYRVIFYLVVSGAAFQVHAGSTDLITDLKGFSPRGSHYFQYVREVPDYELYEAASCNYHIADVPEGIMLGPVGSYNPILRLSTEEISALYDGDLPRTKLEKVETDGYTISNEYWLTSKRKNGFTHLIVESVVPGSSRSLISEVLLNGESKKVLGYTNFYQASHSGLVKTAQCHPTNKQLMLQFSAQGSLFD